MTFAGINYLAVLIAAAAGWVAGAVWYMALAKPWMAAVGTHQGRDRGIADSGPARRCRSSSRLRPV